jgi:hypothetical protein
LTTYSSPPGVAQVRDDLDSLSFGIENLQANHLIVVVFT